MSELHTIRGDTIRLSVGPIIRADGTVQDITGYTIKFTAKAKIEDDDPGVIQVAGTVVDGPAGLGQVEIPASDTTGFTTDRVLLWDVQITDPGGKKKTVDSGKMIVVRDVTRS